MPSFDSNVCGSTPYFMMNTNSPAKTSIPTIAWFIWGLGAIFYFAQYLLRVVPSVINEDLMALFEMSASLSGMLGGFFYYPYVAMQIPIGTIVDKYGSKRLLAMSAFVCAISACLFAVADSIITLFVSRFLLGLFSAAAFVCALKLARSLFPASLFGLIVGITQTLGMLGAGLDGPISHINENFGYHGIFWALSLLFIFISVMSLILIKDSSPSPSSQKNSSFHWHVIKDKYVWINAIYAGFVYAPVQVLGEYWGPFFLERVYDLSDTQAAWAKSMLFVGWVIGGPFAGKLSDIVGRRKIMIWSSLAGIILISFMFLGPQLPIVGVFSLCFLIGATNTGLVAAYAASGELHDKASSGLSLAICNMISILFGAILISVCAILLDLVSSGLVDSSFQRIYTRHDLLISFSVLPLCSLFALFFAFKMKETYEK